jgi:predicted RNA binding protein YcfA (HicA-like mRNA interferase family)
LIERLKTVPAREWLAAVERSCFRLRKERGSRHVYQHPDGRRVLVVYHKLSDTFGPKTIRQLLTSLEWTEADVTRAGLIK